MTKKELLQKANDLPLAPGVYLMMDKTGKVIYLSAADIDSIMTLQCDVSN